jgi:hypothetical protein
MLLMTIRLTEVKIIGYHEKPLCKKVFCLLRGSCSLMLSEFVPSSSYAIY